MTKPLARDQAKTVRRIYELNDRNDPSKQERSWLLTSLPYETGLSLGRELFGIVRDFGQQQWDENRICTEEHALILIQNLLAVAWKYANRRQTGNVGKSLAKIRALLWLIGEMDLYACALGEYVEDGQNFRTVYDYCGKVALQRISERVRFDWKAADDDQWYEIDRPWIDKDGNAEDCEPITADEALR